MKGINWSGGNVERMPIIGFAHTQPISMGQLGCLPASKEAVVEIVENREIYILNSWHKPGVPRILHKSMVSKWEPAKTISNQ